MSDNTKGYWFNKTKDRHTIDRLSESKHIEIIQYNRNGEIIKIWPSIKEAAISCFNDYRIISGHSKTKLYSILNCTAYKNRIVDDSIWFYKSEILDFYNEVPSCININEMIAEQKRIKSERLKIHMAENPLKPKKRYTVIQLDENDNIINQFNDINEAGKTLNQYPLYIARACRGEKKILNLNLKYGPKK